MTFDTMYAARMFARSRCLSHSGPQCAYCNDTPKALEPVLREVYNKGAEDMREQVAVKVGKVNDFLANSIRAMPIKGGRRRLRVPA